MLKDHEFYLSFLKSAEVTFGKVPGPLSFRGVWAGSSFPKYQVRGSAAWWLRW